MIFANLYTEVLLILIFAAIFLLVLIHIDRKKNSATKNSSTTFGNTIYGQFLTMSDEYYETLYKAFRNSLFAYQNGSTANSFNPSQFRTCVLVLKIITALAINWIESEETNKPQYKRINLQKDPYPFRILEGYALYIVDELLNDNQTYLKNAWGSNQTLRQRMKLPNDKKLSEVFRNLTGAAEDPSIYNVVAEIKANIHSGIKNQKESIQTVQSHIREKVEYQISIDEKYLSAKSNLGDIPFRLVADENEPLQSKKLIEGLQSLRFDFMYSLIFPYYGNDLSYFVRENPKTIGNTIELVQLYIQESFEELNKPMHADMDSYLAALAIAAEKNS